MSTKGAPSKRSPEFNFDTKALIQEGATPNWTRDFPVVGEGTLIFSIQRSTPFSIVVRPKLDPGEPGANQWIALEVHRVSANFKIGLEDHYKQLKQVEGIVNLEQVGYEPGKKISYWFSYDRDLLTLKYGKGYRMEQTTLMEFNFLTGDKKIDEKTRESLKYLFSPTIRRRIEQYDLEGRKEMIQRYAARFRDVGFKGQSLQQMFPNLKAEAIGVKSESLAKSIIDIEHQVNFDKEPFVCNWSAFVLDSSKVNLFELDDNKYTFSASLPPACQELYFNVTAPNVNLDWSPEPTKYRLSDAIRYSLQGPNGKLYKTLKSKTGEFGDFSETYLRVTLGSNRGSSPGIPYVLEIWPMNHGSPIHNHGNAYAVIHVLHGGLTIKVFNKHVDRPKAPPLMKFDVKAGDTTWISPNWFQTHQLWNSTEDYCATVQCYQYGVNDLTHWPYFDYVASTKVIDEFLPDSDYTFHEMRDTVLKEFTEFMDHAPTVN
ncbi:hypothetical protein GBAR_LOCUS17619 [Geodia barretti]|uniref:Cysteine dioxygenase n=1 Tax=Geodia barretti TaxID=519541 RepID=A0AA35SKF7_GEOBA|nr:hypothetical protein GBAR_LOCUS17619 [Geodia barretti]